MIGLRADSSGELLFWFIVAFVWVVVQVLARLSQRSSEAAPEKPRPPSEAQERLTRLLQEVTGIKVEVPVPTPPVEEAPPPPPPPPRSSRPAARRPAVKSPTYSDEGRVRREPVRIAVTSLMTMPLPRQALSYMVGLHVPITPVDVIPLEPVLPGRYRPDLRGREQLRRAVVARIVLGPPVALRPPYESW